MYENISDLLKQIALGEDSVLELKAVEFSGNKVATKQFCGSMCPAACLSTKAQTAISVALEAPGAR